MPEKKLFHLLIPPNWQTTYLPLWFQEDFPGLDVASAIVGDFEAKAQILFKSSKVNKKIIIYTIGVFSVF